MAANTETENEHAADTRRVGESRPQSSVVQFQSLDDFPANDDLKHGLKGNRAFPPSIQNIHVPRSCSILDPTEIIFQSIEGNDTKPVPQKRSRGKRKRQKGEKKARLDKFNEADKKNSQRGLKRELSSQIPLNEPKALAARPRVPDPLDDDEDPTDDFAVSTGAVHESTSQNEDEEQGEAERGTASPVAPPSATPPASPVPAPAPARSIRQPRQRCRLIKSGLDISSDLDKLSVEIRYMIYEEILTVPQPINVHSGWQQVYQRERPCIPIGILCTCKRFYKEAIEVLYGSNTFLYRLRDKIPSMTDVNLIAHIDDDVATLPTTTNDDDDEAGDEDEDLEPDDVNDPDWQEDFMATIRPQHPRRARLRKGAPIIQPDIHVRKHMPLFRRLIIEAEKNRFATATKTLMANAIQIFAFKLPAAKHAAAPTTNIKTLTIRVAPQWDPAGGQDGHGRFTFVDFFDADSPVVPAIKNLNCQFLQLDLMTRYMDGSRTHAGCRFTMDMRYKRIVDRIRDVGHDGWAHDRATQLERRRKAAVVERALNSLDVQVREFCETFLRCEVWDWDGWDVISV
ncbi:hypothetical protein E4U21_001707 [Claviceps maximensis]|nr:hypothetical protein E4U21_001707 [Claviceps maximensis]